MNHRRVSDLRVVVGVILGAALALLVPGVPWQIEWVFGLPLLLFAPGYAIVAALFPTAPTNLETDPAAAPGWAVRIALSLVISAVVVAVVGVLLAALGLLQLVPVVLLLAAVSLGSVGIAWIRRWQLPPGRKADPLAEVSLGSLGDGLETSRGQTALLVVAVLALVGALAFAGGTAASDEPYSEAYLSTGGDADAVRADNGTRTLVADQPNTVQLTIGNHEGESTAYTVVFELQDIGPDGTVRDQQRLDSFDARLAANETAVYDRELTPSIRGDRLRLRTLIYTGEDSSETAAPDLVLRHWITVREGSA